MANDGHPHRPLLTLQAGRGLAALAVVLHHAGQGSDAFASGTQGEALEWGAHGVDFFFVLSGFIIFFVHGSDPGTVDAGRSYLLKRLRRIFVPYYPVALVMIAAYLLVPGLSQANREWGWLTSLTLLPSAQPPALSVAWTLVFEICFYLFFLIGHFSGTLRVLAAGWAAAVGLAWATQVTLPAALSTYLLNPLVLEFLAGMTAAWLFRRLPNGLTLWPALAGLALWALYLSIPEAHRVLLGLSFAGLILSAALLERRRPIPIPRALLLLGAGSYAIYLVHNPLMSLVARVFGPTGWGLTFAACCLSGIAVGLAYHRLYEIPALRALTPASRREPSFGKACVNE